MMSHRATKRIAGIFALMALAFTFQLVNAGNNGFFRNNSVGGISINSDGVVSNVDLESRKLLLKEMRQNLKPAEGKMAAKPNYVWFPYADWKQLLQMPYKTGRALYLMK